MRLPSVGSFSTGSSSTARRPSRSASSFRPRAASIEPSKDRAPASSGCARTCCSCSARAAVKAARALASSFVIRPIRPSMKCRLYLTAALPKLFSPIAAKALAAATGSCSANAQMSQRSATLCILPGSFARSSSINLCKGWVSAFQSSSTNARLAFLSTSFGRTASRWSKRASSSA